MFLVSFFSPYATTFLIQILLLTLQHVSIETGLRAGPYGVRIPRQTLEFSILQIVQTGSWAPKKLFLFNEYRRFFPGSKAAGA